MIFVTGGTGLLGAHLLFQLTKDETKTRAIYRSDRKRDQVKQLFNYYDKEHGEKRYATIEWVKGDILDIPFLQENMKDCNEVYHSAALYGLILVWSGSGPQILSRLSSPAKSLKIDERFIENTELNQTMPR